jgi:hypothetical protein
VVLVLRLLVVVVVVVVVAVVVVLVVVGGLAPRPLLRSLVQVALLPGRRPGVSRSSRRL